MDDKGERTWTCRACKRTLPLTREYFYYNHTRKHGFQYICRECANSQDYAWKNVDRVRDKERKRASHVALRQEVLAHYSHGTMRCACCGEGHIQFLAIDHVNGGGHRQRQQIGRNSRATYYWLKVKGFPEGFAVLCHNCNNAKAWDGECPHEAERRKASAGA
jgi:hypothetical protein